MSGAERGRLSPRAALPGRGVGGLGLLITWASVEPRKTEPWAHPARTQPPGQHSRPGSPSQPVAPREPQDLRASPSGWSPPLRPDSARRSSRPSPLTAGGTPCPSASSPLGPPAPTRPLPPGSHAQAPDPVPCAQTWLHASLGSVQRAVSSGRAPRLGYADAAGRAGPELRAGRLCSDPSRAPRGGPATQRGESTAWARLPGQALRTPSAAPREPAGPGTRAAAPRGSLPGGTRRGRDSGARGTPGPPARAS